MFLTVLCVVPLASAQVLLPQGGGGAIIGSGVPCPNETPFIKVTNGVAECAADPGAGSGAPTTATYITRTPDGTLSAEQALGSLGNGIMINTATTGVVSIYPGAACTNQVIEDLSASGAPNCVSITNAYITDATIQEAKLAFTPIKSGSAAGGDLAGTYPNPTIAPNSVALATDTTGRYVGKLTAGTNVTLDNCTEGENVDCTVNATDTVGYTTIADEGTPLVARETINFLGDGVSCVDDPTGEETDCTISTGAGESTTASNVNVGGVGVFKQETGDDLEFRGINAASTKITTVLDAANNEIDIDVVESALNLANIGGSAAKTQISDTGTWEVAEIPNLPASKITTGEFAKTQVSDTGTWETTEIPDLDASKITSGEFDVLRIPDLDASKITGAVTKVQVDNAGTWEVAEIPNLPASKITTGEFGKDQISDTGTWLAAEIPSLDASKITTGELAKTRIADAGTWETSEIPNLDASKITSGTFDAARIGNDTVALSTKTTGNYVGQLTAGANITLDDCTPGEGVNCTISASGSTGYATVEDEGTPLTARTVLNFTGAGVTCTDDGTGLQTDCDIPAAPGGGESNTASNVNVGGVGVFKQKVSTDLQFRGLIAGSSKLTVALDAVDNEIDLDVAEAQLMLSNLGGTLNKGQVASAGTWTAAEIPVLAASKITTGTFDVARIPDLDTAKITTGTFAKNRISSTGTWDAAEIPNLDAGKITTGTFTKAQIADAGTWETSEIPNLDAAKITTGTFPAARIGNDTVALGTKTTGNYVDGVVADQGLAMTGTEGADLGLIDCAANEILKRNAGDTAWECAEDGGAGSGATEFTELTDTPADYTGGAGDFVAVNSGGTALEFVDRTAASVPFDPEGTIEATDTQAAIQEVRDEAIPVTAKDAVSGVAGLTSDTKLKVAQLGSYQANTALSASSQITPAQLFVGIAGSGGPVTLTNAQPITGGVANQVAILTGTDATNTVTFTPQTNLALCGSESSVEVGLGLQSMMVKKDPTGTIWRRLDCGSFPYIDRDIVADESNPVCIGDIANGNMQCFFEEDGVNKHQGYTGGVPDSTTHAEDLNVTGDLTVAGPIHGLVQKASLGLVAPTTDDSGFVQIEWPAEVTLQEIQCSTDTGTVTINIEERARSTPNTTGTEALTADLVCDNDGAVSTAFADAVHAADVPIALQIAAVASTPGVVRVHITAVRN